MRFLPLAMLTACSLGCGGSVAQQPVLNESLFAEEFSDDDSEATWKTAVEPRAFSFPSDHGSHDDYRIEWWYYTGNLRADSGRSFGFQLTFFRTGIQRNSQNSSRWTANDLYTAHFALSDVDNKQHFFSERTNRAGIGLAGAERDQLHVWNGSWRVEDNGQAHLLQAVTESYSLDLRLEPTKGPVLHGVDGLSQKGSTTGNASYYYSFPRMKSSGTVTVLGESFQVEGASWMDHEFSTSFLEPGQLGWDWFSLQLDDGRELMLYQMRLSDGAVDPYSSGTLITQSGDLEHLSITDMTILPEDHWKSPRTGANYPLSWHVLIPKLGLDVKVRPTFAAQEMDTRQSTGIAYWEGAVKVSGTADDVPVTGKGYMELTGYVGQGLGNLFE